MQSWIKILQHAQGPPAQASTCLGPSEFASDHLNDPEEALEKIMWSDETKIKRFGLNSTRCVKKDEIQSHLNCEAWGGIMPWWCFSCCKEDWMAAPHLREDRWGHISWDFGEQPRSLSKTIEVGLWLGLPAWQWPGTHSQPFKVPEWPSHSADLNPTENLWRELKLCVAK